MLIGGDAVVPGLESAIGTVSFAADLAIAATANVRGAVLLANDLTDFTVVDDLVDARTGECLSRLTPAGAPPRDLDAERVRRELDDGVHAGRVARDEAGARAAGVEGTPAFFVNGVLHEGAFDAGSLVEAQAQ